MTIPTTPIDILLVGYGAVGVVMAYELEKGGARVTAVARGNYDLIKENGIKISSPDKFGVIEGYKPHRLVNSIEAAADTTYDFVVCTTKSLPDVSPTESLLKPIIDAGKSKTFILIQNGLGIEEGLYAATRAIDATILSSVIHISTNLIGNRDEVLFERTERLEIGVYHPPTDGRPPVTDDSAAAWVPKPTAVQAAALTKFKEVLEAGGGAVTIEQDMELFRFRKNTWNCAWASVACLARAPIADFLPIIDVVGPSVLEFCEEIALIGNTANLALPENWGRQLYDATIAYRQKGGAHKPSALVDILTGRPFEVECTIGNVLKMGRRVGVKDADMKLLRLVYGLARVIQSNLVKAD